ncbi:tryptophan-rich sensory protein [Aerococcus agrisoli]|uniref:Tryptophan-rich sensory protein n=1 Tax=Aerococcus agrisoli TaxID=2487350 RepID=A0A3N4G1Y6_9LACT|nr:tryptophan-rich sensory protein [Aerococcus agrisoli]RPA56962.1 tryptophan-rich sensory protein [Aerococcus agrisoli]
MSTKWKAWSNVVLLLFTFFVNFLGGSGRINGMSQAAVSDKYHTLITPAGYTFSIWGVIYSLLLVWTVNMALHSKKKEYEKIIEAITPFYWLSLITNMIWIVTFSYEWVGISTTFIFIYLLALIACLNSISSIAHPGRTFSGVTFGLHTGWLLIASVVNVAAFLVQINWSGFGISDTIWAGIVIIVSIVIASYVSNKMRNAVLPLPIAWAFFGIHGALIMSGGNNGLQILAILGFLTMLYLCIHIFIKNGKAILPKNN